MKAKLSQGQRLVAAVLYLVIIVISYSILVGSPADILYQTKQTSVWFFSGILLVVMGKYITEPFYSTPADTLSNSLSLMILLVALTNTDELFGYTFLLAYSIVMLALSFIPRMQN